MNAFLGLPFLWRLALAVGVSALISLTTTPIVKRIACRIGAVDVPKDNRRMHDHPIPRLGGLAIAAGFLVTIFLFTKPDREMQGILLGSLMILVLGIFDDCLALKALPKLIVQIIAACVVVWHGCTIRYLTNPFSEISIDLGWMSTPVTIVWIVMMTNAVNFIDGLDGLAVGVSTISAGTMLAITLLLQEWEVALMMACLMGACVGFAPYNFNPAQIFMGDTGSTFLGFVLASMSIQGLFKMYAVISFVVPFLILGVPFFDVTFAVIRRLAKHQNLMAADRGHIHHRLIDMGLSQKQSVAILYVLTAVLGFAAVLLANSSQAKTFILLAAVFVVAVMGFAVIFGPHQHPSDKSDSRKEQQE